VTRWASAVCDNRKERTLQRRGVRGSEVLHRVLVLRQLGGQLPPQRLRRRRRALRRRPRRRQLRLSKSLVRAEAMESLAPPRPPLAPTRAHRRDSQAGRQ
jgi:hypothetical protein